MASVPIRTLDDAQILSVPASMYYVPNFIDEKEEEDLLSKIAAVPSSRWTNLSRRRLLAYPSNLTPKNALLAAPLPEWLEKPVLSRLQSLRRSPAGQADASSAVFGQSPHAMANHVLINEYRPGQGIMPHEDGAAYYPVVATVSLGGSVVLDIYGKTAEGQRRKQPDYRILQEPRSLLITMDDMYTDYLHGIAEAELDHDLGPETIANWAHLGKAEAFAAGHSTRVTRTSLTFRDVLKVSNIGLRLKLQGSR